MKLSHGFPSSHLHQCIKLLHHSGSSPLGVLLRVRQTTLPPKVICSLQRTVTIKCNRDIKCLPKAAECFRGPQDVAHGRLLPPVLSSKWARSWALIWLISLRSSHRLPPGGEESWVKQHPFHHLDPEDPHVNPFFWEPPTVPTFSTFRNAFDWCKFTSMGVCFFPPGPTHVGRGIHSIKMVIENQPSFHTCG